MDEKEDENDDIDIHKLAFIGSNKENFKFNSFRMPLNFLSTIYNGGISLKEAEISQRNYEKKIEKLKFKYRPKKWRRRRKNKWCIDASKWLVGI